jgi:signal peptidase
MSDRTAPAPLAWALLVARSLATVLVTLTCGLAIWSVLPQAAGWSPSVVMTGSMEPSLHPGDVVLSAPASAAKVTPGQIILVTNPAMPSHLLVHRFVRFTASGDLITKGDANAREDSTPVPPANVRGLPRLRLPYIGLGIVWLHNHAWRQLTFALLAILAVFGLLTSGPTLNDGAAEADPAAGEPVDLNLLDDPDHEVLEDPHPAPVRRLPPRDPATGRFIPAGAGR